MLASALPLVLLLLLLGMVGWRLAPLLGPAAAAAAPVPGMRWLPRG
jgi:hypothetical protein